MLTLPADPYLALGVSRESQLAEIRTAYRKLILKCHPDKIPDPLLKKQKQDEFQRVQQAYELLSSEAERSRYDEIYKLNELQKEMSKMSTSSPNPARSSRRERDPEYYNGARVYTAEPRSSTYASPSPKSYAAGTPGCRSYEEFSIPVYDHHAPRKTASYERSAKSDWEKRSPREEREERERKSKKDDKRDREEKTRKEEKEKRDKKDAERREKEKKKEKEDKKDREEKERKEKKKKTDQVRKKDAELKTQQQKTYVKPTYAPVAYSSSDSDSDEIVRPTKKTSGAREKGQPVVSSERERKYSETMEIATDYLSRSGHSGKTPVNVRTSKPQATDQFMRHINIPAVPTPPPVGTGPHAPLPSCSSPV
ncbi:DnaJ domain-containing protein [Microdochium nivale]|nr:DnaJ domain-containing protein [Microdochium nivale]